MAKINIGKKIKEVLDETAISVVDFAKSIGLTRNGAYKVFEKETIDTGQLQKISKVLKHDFFAYYTSPSEIVMESKVSYGFATKDELEQLTHTVQSLVKEIEKLRNELKPVAKTAQSKKNGSKKSK